MIIMINQSTFCAKKALAKLGPKGKPMATPSIC